MDGVRQFFEEIFAQPSRNSRRLNLEKEIEELKFEEAVAITIVCFMLSAIALSSVYTMCKARRNREGMGYQEVQRPENAFEMMSLGGREGINMVLPQGY